MCGDVYSLRLTPCLCADLRGLIDHHNLRFECLIVDEGVESLKAFSHPKPKISEHRQCIVRRRIPDLV
jgi:hypothetical protein